jgi:hypothetical protein
MQERPFDGAQDRLLPRSVASDGTLIAAFAARLLRSYVGL